MRRWVGAGTGLLGPFMPVQAPAFRTEVGPRRPEAMVGCSCKQSRLVHPDPDNKCPR